MRIAIFLDRAINIPTPRIAPTPRRMRRWRSSVRCRPFSALAVRYWSTPAAMAAGVDQYRTAKAENGLQRTELRQRRIRRGVGAIRGVGIFIARSKNMAMRIARPGGRTIAGLVGVGIRCLTGGYHQFFCGAHGSPRANLVS